MDPIVVMNEVTKVFKSTRRQPGMWGFLKSLVRPQVQEIRAVDQVSFTLQPGELVGYLGPNGAGKSTTIKMLTGLLVPSGGEVIANGFVPWRDRSRYVARIGAVFGQRTTLWWDLPVIESFELLQPMYRVPRERFKRNLEDFVDLLEMREFLHTPVRSLSLGQRMRADLCAALLHEPPLVFLDEPTIGLDVVARERIRQFILHIHQSRGVTVLLTTHDLSDIEKLCDRLMILDHGKLLFDGSLTDLNNRFESDWLLMVTFEQEYSDVSLPGLEPVRQDRLRAVYPFNHRRTSSTDLIQQLLQRYRIADLEVRRPPLEETIRRIYEERLLLPPNL